MCDNVDFSSYIVNPFILSFIRSFLPFSYAFLSLLFVVGCGVYGSRKCPIYYLFLFITYVSYEENKSF